MTHGSVQKASWATWADGDLSVGSGEGSTGPQLPSLVPSYFLHFDSWQWAYITFVTKTY